MRVIDADVLLKDLTKAKREVNCHLPEVEKLFKGLRDWIKDAPTVDAVPVKHGRWEQVFEERTIHGSHCSAPNFRCSACKKWWFHNGECVKWMKYCPECGAKMDGEKVSE